LTEIASSPSAPRNDTGEWPNAITVNVMPIGLRNASHCASKTLQRAPCTPAAGAIAKLYESVAFGELERQLS
jgi:hypothetical protein